MPPDASPSNNLPGLPGRDLMDSLLRRSVLGDAEAIGTLLDLHRPDIQRFAARLCAGPEDAEDVVQHTLYVLFSRIGSFRKLSRLTSWLFAIVKHECLRRLRGRKETVPVREEMLRSFDGPDSRLMQAQLVGAVTEGIARLDPDLRVVLLLREMERVSAAETAALLGLSVPAVKSRLHRARAALREELAPLARQWDLV